MKADKPVMAVLIGLFAVAAGFLFAAARGSDAGGWSILLFGLVLAFLWTAVLRVGSQMSLFLAPLAAVMLLLGWAHIKLPGSDRELVPNKTYIERERSGRLLQAPGSIITGSGSEVRAGAATGAAPATSSTTDPTAPAPVRARSRTDSRTDAADFRPEIRDEHDRIEVLPPAPSGLPRPFDPALVEDPALLQPKFAAPRAGSGTPRPATARSKIE